jgi:hypothetical protein
MADNIHFSMFGDVFVFYLKLNKNKHVLFLIILIYWMHGKTLFFLLIVFQHLRFISSHFFLTCHISYIFLSKITTRVSPMLLNWTRFGIFPTLKFFVTISAII